MRYRIERGIEIEPLPEASVSSGGSAPRFLTERIGFFRSFREALDVARELDCPSPDEIDSPCGCRVLGFIRVCLHDPGGEGDGTVIETVESEELLKAR